MKYALNILIFATLAVFSFSALAENTAKKQNVKATTAKNTKKAAPKKSAAKKADSKKSKVVEEEAHKFIRKYGDWELYRITEGGQKVCFITSPIESEKGTFKNRGTPHILVSYRGSAAEVSVSSGYPYKKDSFVDVQIDKGDKLDFFTSDKTPKTAWAKDAKSDADVIQKMRKGSKVVITGTSSRNTTSTDTYSLKGFSAAYNGLLNSCK
jgi:invasion protein IalB